MPTFGPYTTLNARVKQKIATDAYWTSISDDLGVIFEGEQAFVYSEDGVAVNFKIGDGTKKYTELPFFIAYYNGLANQKVLSWVNNTADLTISSKFRINSLLIDIVFYNNSGSVIPLKIGTTSGGNEIAEISIPVGAVTLGLKYAFSDSETVYLSGLSGLEASIFLLYIQMDEAPAIPPSAGGGAFKLPIGFTGVWRPITGGLQYTDVWDFITGFAKPGFGFDNCVICGIEGTKSMAGAGSIGFQTGQTLQDYLGNLGNTVSLTVDDLAPFTVTTKIPRDRYHTQSGGTDSPFGTVSPTEYVPISSDPIGTGLPVSIQNYAIIDLWYVAIS